MCGILGIASANVLGNTSWFEDGLTSIKHRGPDGNGVWQSKDKKVILGHRRLAIVELSPLGYQPMHLTNYGLSIVFNGEIYNFIELRNTLKKHGHSFRTGSDTEVLLAAYAQWGIDCLSHLNGMFAFALYDAPRQKLVIARDRAGEKPLFYRLEGGSIFFASELKALLVNQNLPRRVNPEALDCYLAMGFVPGDRCILEGYNKLPAAHVLHFDLQSGDAKLSRYWELPEFETADKIDEIALLDELEKSLENSVSLQLHADVPVGVLLSGGLDSSLVTALATRSSRQVRTFSVGFPGYGKMDETPHARLIARHFGTEHTELMVDQTSAEVIFPLIRQFDEPIVDSSMFPTFLVSKLVRQHCTVALSGDGGDELFGGYNHYKRLLWMQRWSNFLHPKMRREITKVATHLLPVGFKGRNYLQGLDMDIRQGLPLIASYFDAKQRQYLLREYPSRQISAEDIHEFRTPKMTDLLQRATRMDFENYLVEDILVKVDRTSMLNSLEMRAPLLDYRIIDFAYRKVPSFLKATDREKKIILKKLAAKILPPEFDKQRKQGFSIPLTDWLKGGVFRDLFWETLTSSDCFFDSKTVRKLLRGQDQGHNNGERLFALVQFELWRKFYGAQF